jgi:EAL domain-containing protein (putative c-di-GMP-specific phosphodiesterase class I)
MTPASGSEPHSAEVPAAELARAIAAGEIVPWYQPIVDLDSGEVIGIEALARWEHPEGDVGGAAGFVPVAERTDLIIELDRAVMARALADLARWRVEHPALRLSVNLSGRHLDQDSWVETMRQVVGEARVPPSAVDLELTETARPSNLAASEVMMTRIRALGFRIWFDDFGTGWFELRDAVRLPLDGLKIDRSFTDGLGSVDDSAICALIQLATELGLKTTIEGITTVRQATLARSLGCDYGQGFLFSPPVPALDVPALLRAGPYLEGAVPEPERGVD